MIDYISFFCARDVPDFLHFFIQIFILSEFFNQLKLHKNFEAIFFLVKNVKGILNWIKLSIQCSVESHFELTAQNEKSFCTIKIRTKSEGALNDKKIDIKNFKNYLYVCCFRPICCHLTRQHFHFIINK